MEFLEKIASLERKLGGPSATAEAIGVSRHTLWRWKAGTRNPDRQSQMVVDFLHDQAQNMAEDQAGFGRRGKYSTETVIEKLSMLEDKYGGPVAAARAVGASYNSWWRWKTGSRHPSARFQRIIDTHLEDEPEE